MRYKERSSLSLSAFVLFCFVLWGSDGKNQTDSNFKTFMLITSGLRSKLVIPSLFLISMTSASKSSNINSNIINIK